MAEERPSAVTLQGNPLTLIGPEIKVGDQAPDFNSLEGPGNLVSLNTYNGKVKLFNVIVSVDTPVCDIQTKRFNNEASDLPEDVEILTVSMDLPFAQSRYCGDAGIERLRNLSDHQDASFGESYGVLIKENRLLARAIFVVDKDDIVRHVEYVSEVADEPNYEAALGVLKSLI
ncbi:MAG: thiol peroxidase [Thermodesulfobacteriota bacterium]